MVHPQFPPRVTLTECFARDGLQALERVLTTQEKLRFLKRIIACGFKRVELTSLVPPRYLPQFYDAEEVLRALLTQSEGTGSSPLLIVFVPNEKGALRLEPFACENPERIAILTVVSASETHNFKNLHRSRVETLEEQRRIAEFAHRYGFGLIGSIAVAFGCPYEGAVPVEEVFRLAEHYRNLCFHALQLGDTTGMANPLQVSQIFRELIAEFPQLEPIAHFHDNRGAALANSLAALSVGVTIVDTCLGGLGGRPPDQRLQGAGPTGNTSTEDLAVLLAEMGVETGLDENKLLELGRELSRFLGSPLFSHVIHSLPVSSTSYSGEERIPAALSS